MTHNLLSINLVPRHSYTSDSLYLDGKNRAVLRSFRPQTGPAPKRDTTQRPPLDSATFTIFYCRAVSGHSCHGFNSVQSVSERQKLTLTVNRLIYKLITY